MKLADLGLKTKPATKYFDHGYIKFRTENKELYHEVVLYDDRRNPFTLTKFGLVNSKEELNHLLSIKTRAEVIVQ